MRKTTMAVGLLISLATGGMAQAKECTIMYYQLFLTPQRALLEENSTGATFTLLDSAVGESITIDLERKVLTVVETKENITNLVGEATIKSGTLANEMTVVMADQALPSGQRHIAITSVLTTPSATFTAVTASGLIGCTS